MTEQGWRKSSYSGGQGGNCVEVATQAAAGSVMVRDSQDIGGPVLSFDCETWRKFLVEDCNTRKAPVDARAPTGASLVKAYGPSVGC